MLDPITIGEDGARYGVHVEVSYDSGGTWHPSVGSVTVLEDRAGIWFGLANPTAMVEPGGNWSEMNKKRVKRMIKQGRMTEAGLKSIEEAKRHGTWSKRLIRENPTKIPADLKRALVSNKAAGRNFENLAPSYRKHFISWITSAKRDETRQRRIKETVRLASQNKKPGMM